MALIKNGKFFQMPERNDEDFKTLFARVAAAGIGRPVDKDGCPQGPWTPDLLTDAICQIEANRDGIELRTVQLWFENNDKGISAQNIRWLARVLGCNDPVGASAWQAELAAAQSRLAAKRRAQRRGPVDELAVPDGVEPKTSAMPPNPSPESTGRLRLARATEAMFASGSLLNLPAAVFAGAVALQLCSYFLSVHDVTYQREDGIAKQVGFLWAPNWTLLFIVCLPLYLALVVDQVIHWKGSRRAHLLDDLGDDQPTREWLARVDSSSHSYWAVFLICVGFAGLAQWISVRLLPLLNDGGRYAADWGARHGTDPDNGVVAHLIAFTGAAYLYMCLCFYLFVAGLILLCNIIDDFKEARTELAVREGNDRSPDVDAIGMKIMRGVVRCTIAGFLIATCMKLQSLYIVNSAPNILSWLVLDVRGALGHADSAVIWDEASTPTNFTSLIVLFLVLTVYLYGSIRIGAIGQVGWPITRATASVAFLVLVYFSMGVVDGFSLLLGIALILSVYGLFDPDFGQQGAEQPGQAHVL